MREWRRSLRVDGQCGCLKSSACADAVVPGAGSIDLEALGAGLISETYRVARDGVAYTLKVAAEHRPDLGVDLPWEVRVLERAASAGLAPRLVYCDLDGRGSAHALGRGTFVGLARGCGSGKPGKICRAAAPGSRPRGADAGASGYSAAVDQKSMSTALSRRTSTSSDPALRRAALARAQALSELPRAVGVVCHSDLHAMNVLQEDDSLILLDWEYAHVTDPLWDLAGWCANNDFDAEVQRVLLTRYLGQRAEFEPVATLQTAARALRLRLLAVE